MARVSSAVHTRRLLLPVGAPHRALHQTNAAQASKNLCSMWYTIGSNQQTSAKPKIRRVPLYPPRPVRRIPPAPSWQLLYREVVYQRGEATPDRRCAHPRMPSLPHIPSQAGLQRVLPHLPGSCRVMQHVGLHMGPVRRQPQRPGRCKRKGLDAGCSWGM